MKRLSFVEIAAIVVGALALVGAAFTIYIFASNEVKVGSVASKEETKQSEEIHSSTDAGPKLTEKTLAKDTTSALKPAGIHTAEENKPIIIESEEPIEQKKPVVVAKSKPEVKKENQKPRDEKVLQNKKRENTKSTSRKLTQVELNRLIANIYELKSNKANRSACVVIRQSYDSNIIEGLTDVARALQERGFIIAGRQRVPGKAKGVVVRWPNECITVTIGTV